MDFVRLIRSLEELLYEVMSWLLFYPRTLWRVTMHPSTIAAYADAELDEQADEQFIDLMSPPLFFMLSILLAHLLEVAFHLNTAEIKSELGKEVLGSSNNLLAFRAIFFSLFPVLMAALVLRSDGRRIDRKSLQRPFYLQCFFAGPFVLFASCGITIGRVPGLAANWLGGVLALAAVVWYIVVVAWWLQSRRGIARGRAFAIVTGLFLAVLVGSFAAAGLLFFAV
jgi:hypothetical protein